MRSELCQQVIIITAILCIPCVGFVINLLTTLPVLLLDLNVEGKVRETKSLIYVNMLTNVFMVQCGSTSCMNPRSKLKCAVCFHHV